MRSILLVGSIGADKMTSEQRLQGLLIKCAKTQAIETFASTIDASGKYLEVGRYKHVPMLAFYDVGAVALVQSVTNDETRFPPGFTTTFSCEVLEVATRAGVAAEVQVHDAVGHLVRAGAYRIVAVDSVTGKGFKRAQGVLCRTSS